MLPKVRVSVSIIPNRTVGCQVSQHQGITKGYEQKSCRAISVSVLASALGSMVMGIAESVLALPLPDNLFALGLLKQNLVNKTESIIFGAHQPPLYNAIVRPLSPQVHARSQ